MFKTLKKQSPYVSKLQEYLFESGLAFIVRSIMFLKYSCILRYTYNALPAAIAGLSLNIFKKKEII